MALLLLLASAVAFIQVLVWAQILGPGRDDPRNFSDQTLYELLGRTLASTGIYARQVGDGGLVPEPLRTFGYPAFLAVLFRTLGADYSVIVGAQALLLATMPPVVFLMARQFLSPRLSLLGAWAVALYPPLAYYAALAQADFFATYMLTIGVALLAWAHKGSALTRAILAGALFGWAAATRPALIAIGLAVAFWILLRPCQLGALPRRSAATFLVALLIFPGLSTVYTRLNFSDYAVEFGGPLWEGYWQGVWPGLANNEFEALAGSGASTAAIERRAIELSVPPARVLAYVTELEEVTRVSQANGPNERNIIGVANEVARQRLSSAFARRDITEDLAGFVLRGATYRAFALWASDIPWRKDQIDLLPRTVVYAMWIPQIALLLLSMIGLVASARRSPLVPLFGVILISMWIAHFPFSSQPRYSLPARPEVLMLATAGVAWLIQRRGSKGRSRGSHTPPA